jgi:hypothetical protein
MAEGSSSLPVAAAPPAGLTGRALGWSGAALVAATWTSSAVFGAYIAAFYLVHAAGGRLASWNANLPGLYAPGQPAAVGAIGAHMAAGGVLLVLGPLQLMGAVRRRWPAFHRWTGRLYVTAAGAAGLGGLAFILLRGTIGLAPMNLGFGLYGALVVLCAAQTYRHARARRLVQHRAWAIRLFALVVGSWLYRMEYGFWLPLTHDAGHTGEFRGPVDAVMDFFFYVPNLLLAEAFVRARVAPAGAPARALAATALALATGVVVLGTYYFTRVLWGPAILAALAGRG